MLKHALNTDAHAENHSALLDERGRARLAPAYDVAPLLTLGQPRFALDISGRSLVEEVDEDTLYRALRAWAGTRSRQSITRVADAVRGLIETGSPAAAVLPEEVLDGLLARASEFAPPAAPRPGRRHASTDLDP